MPKPDAFTPKGPHFFRSEEITSAVEHARRISDVTEVDTSMQVVSGDKPDDSIQVIMKERCHAPDTDKDSKFGASIVFAPTPSGHHFQIRDVHCLAHYDPEGYSSRTRTNVIDYGKANQVVESTSHASRWAAGESAAGKKTSRKKRIHTKSAIRTEGNTMTWKLAVDVHNGKSPLEADLSSIFSGEKSLLQGPATIYFPTNDGLTIPVTIKLQESDTILGYMVAISTPTDKLVVHYRFPYMPKGGTVFQIPKLDDRVMQGIHEGKVPSLLAPLIQIAG